MYSYSMEFPEILCLKNPSPPSLWLPLCMTLDSPRNMIWKLISIQGWIHVIIILHYFIHLIRQFFLPIFFAIERFHPIISSPSFLKSDRHRKSFFNFPQFFCHLYMWEHTRRHVRHNIQFFHYEKCVGVSSSRLSLSYK